MSVVLQISKVLTENQDVKRRNIKLRQNLEEAVDKLEIIFGEKIDLENFTEALQVRLDIDSLSCVSLSPIRVPVVNIVFSIKEA